MVVVNSTAICVDDGSCRLLSIDSHASPQRSDSFLVTGVSEIRVVDNWPGYSPSPEQVFV